MLLELHDVCRSFGKVQALRNVNLALEPGAIGLIGNNGAGKSTLLKILLGLLKPDKGSGAILGFDIRARSYELRGRVGYMAESANLVPLLKGVEYVTLAGELYGMPGRDAKRRAHEVLNYVGLGELRYRSLDEYSAGNVQRLKLAAALVHDPDLLLLDEPTNGLDPAGRESMLTLLEDLLRETRKSVILCTHLLGDVARVCNHVVVMDRGAVTRSDTLVNLQSAIPDRYLIDYEGGPAEGERFCAAITRQGARIEPRARGGQLLVDTPKGWRAKQFFSAAIESGLILTQIRQDEEDLARMFYRATDSLSSTAAGAGGLPSEEHTRSLSNSEGR